MSDTPSTAKGGDSFDLSEFYQVFFEAAGENIVLMDKQLIRVDVDSPDTE